MRPTFRIGPGLLIVSATESGVQLTGTARLPPGRVVSVVGLSPAAAAGRAVYVRSWQVAQIDEVVTYRGFVEWTCTDPPIPSGAATQGARTDDQVVLEGEKGT